MAEQNAHQAVEDLARKITALFFKAFPDRADEAICGAVVLCATLLRTAALSQEDREYLTAKLEEVYVPFNSKAVVLRETINLMHWALEKRDA